MATGKCTVERSISIVNESCQRIATSSRNKGALDIPTGHITRIVFGFYTISDEENATLEFCILFESLVNSPQCNRSQGIGRTSLSITIHAHHIDFIFIIITTNKNAGRESFIHIAPEIPTAVVRVDIHFVILAIFNKERHGALPSFVIRQEHIEILYVRRFSFDIRLGRIVKIRLNPKFICILPEILTRKARTILKLNVSPN